MLVSDFLIQKRVPQRTFDIFLPTTVHSAKFARNLPTERIICGDYGSAMHCIIADELLRNPNRAIDIIASLPCNTATLHDIWYAVPDGNPLCTAIGEYVNLRILSDSSRSQVSAFKELDGAFISDKTYSYFAQLLCMLQYHVIKLHEHDPKWRADDSYVRKLKNIMCTPCEETA